MRVLFLIVLLTAVVPLGRAWLGNRRTSLLQAVHWAMLAWIAWVWTTAFAEADESMKLEPGRYLALCLTGCAAVAVLGARRPHVGAWNFVVLGLLAVMVLPLAENLLTEPKPLDVIRIVFLAGTLAVGVLNYLPTRLAAAAVLLAAACVAETWLLVNPGQSGGVATLSPLLLGLVPWTAWIVLARRPPPRSQFDRLWLDFRDRFGFVWAQRVREQFNRSAANAGWTARLYWQGLFLKSGSLLPDSTAQDQMLEALEALLKRFSYEEAEERDPEARARE
jgi:hypothetical protein